MLIYERCINTDSEITIDGRRRVSRIIPCLPTDTLEQRSNGVHDEALKQRLCQFDATEFISADGTFCYKKWKVTELQYGVLRGATERKGASVATYTDCGTIIVTIRRVKNVVALPPGAINHELGNTWQDGWETVRLEWKSYKEDSLSPAGYAIHHDAPMTVDLAKRPASVRAKATNFARSNTWVYLDSKEQPFATFIFKYRCASELLIYDVLNGDLT